MSFALCGNDSARRFYGRSQNLSYNDFPATHDRRKARFPNALSFIKIQKVTDAFLNVRYQIFVKFSYFDSQHFDSTRRHIFL